MHSPLAGFTVRVSLLWSGLDYGCVPSAEMSSSIKLRAIIGS
jgi:hypothetical protein